MKRSGSSHMGLFTIGIAALFLAGFFLLVILGAHAYRNTVRVQTANNRSRALLNYFETCLSANDSEGAVSVEDSEYGTVLVIRDGDTGYGMRIYRCDSGLVEDYARLDAALSPDRAMHIEDTALFSVEQVCGDTLRVTTDAGSILLHIRCEGGLDIP